MLQFITKYPAKRPIPEQVSAVLKGGCRWIELSAPDLDEDSMRKIAESIIPECREKEAFVIMRDHKNLAAELRLGGIFLDYYDNPRKVREELGGEAIIGVLVSDLQSIIDMRSADVDYLVMIMSDTSQRDEAIATVALAREKGVEIPIVAQGEFSLEEMHALKGAGFSGVAVSATLADADDPVALTHKALEALSFD